MKRTDWALLSPAEFARRERTLLNDGKPHSTLVGFSDDPDTRQHREEQAEDEAAAIALVLLRKRRLAILAVSLTSAPSLAGLSPDAYAEIIRGRVRASVARLLGSSPDRFTVAMEDVVRSVVVDSVRDLAKADTVAVLDALSRAPDVRAAARDEVVRIVTYRDAAGATTSTMPAEAVASAVAITAIYDAANGVALESYRARGFTKVEWRCDLSPCDICAPCNGVVLPIGSVFPSGVTAPTVHPHCQCILIPRR